MVIIRAAMSLGIHGYVFKDDAVNDLVKAVRMVIIGKQYISNDNTRLNSIGLNNESIFSALTMMGWIVVLAIANQKTTKQIAEENFASFITEENLRANICKKLNLYGNNSLLKFALSMVDYLEKKF